MKQTSTHTEQGYSSHAYGDTSFKGHRAGFLR